MHYLLQENCLSGYYMVTFFEWCVVTLQNANFEQNTDKQYLYLEADSIDTSN